MRIPFRKLDQVKIEKLSHPELLALANKIAGRRGRVQAVIDRAKFVAAYDKRELRHYIADNWNLVNPEEVEEE
jgi:hypothetical protein